MRSLGSAFSAFHNQGTRGVDTRDRARLQAKGNALYNSIRFRVDGILVHLDLLDVEQEDALLRLATRDLDELESRTILRHAATRQRHLFDDVAFTVGSAYDYFGNFVGLVFHGERRIKMKWKRLIQYADNRALETRDHNCSRIHDSATAAVALEVEAGWFHELTEYRADAIHYKADDVNANMTTVWVPTPPALGFHAHVPPEFVRRLSRGPVRPPSLEEGASLIPCAEWLSEQALSDLAAMADALERDIGA